MTAAAPTIRAQILDEAKRITTEDRNSTYGEPEDLFEAIALIWDGIDRARGERPRSAADVAIYLQGLKLARQAANPDRTDSWVDAAGYAACGAEIVAIGAAEQKGPVS